jgi:hypothetical protein
LPGFCADPDPVLLFFTLSREEGGVKGKNDISFYAANRENDRRNLKYGLLKNDELVKSL